MHITSRVPNEVIASTLERVAGLLQAQHANRYRIEAYRRAAGVIRECPRSITAILEEGGTAAVEALPDIGRGMASAIRELVSTGRLGLLCRLEGGVSPEDLFMRVPGIGEGLAGRIHATLDIDTLEELEQAAHDGRLEALPGIGTHRVVTIRTALDFMLGPSVRRRARKSTVPGVHAGSEPVTAPAVGTLLEVDSEYTRKASRGELYRIAPHRHNPLGRHWLPIMHTERDGWVFTVLYSNTGRAHESGKTTDWVVVYYEKDGDENQATVVTEQRGPLSGCRVVRGREQECSEYYATHRDACSNRSAPASAALAGP